MIVRFLGCPRSGKTTTAARVFANLKESGFKCEFIPEYARFYIAQKRVSEKLTPEQPVKLSNEDQLNIMSEHMFKEKLMLKATGEDAIIVTDSSPLNALLYMSEEFLKSDEVQSLIMLAKNDATFNFYAAPVPWVGGIDPNRVHTRDEALEIDRKIMSVVLPLLTESPVTLIGEPDARCRLATSSVLRAIMAQ